MDNIYFIGFMGTGKTTISKLIADHLNMKWTDLDDMIQQKEKRPLWRFLGRMGKNISEILKKRF